MFELVDLVSIQSWLQKNSKNFETLLDPVFFTIPTKFKDQFYLLLSQHQIVVKDNLQAQTQEMEEILKCTKKWDPQTCSAQIQEILNTKLHFVLFPWDRPTIIPILSHDLFYELITWRNKNKINAAEQAIIEKKKIGVVGCSVGSTLIKTMAKVGLQYFHIAETKNIKPSNSSRICQDSIKNYGEHKMTSLIKQIYEYNPYTQIKVFFEGLNQNNLDQFFPTAIDQKLDLVIDAADDPKIKLKIRSICQEQKLPLLTGFDERGTIKIYRYDLNTPVVDEHKLLEIDKLEKLKETSPRHYILKILDFFPGGYDKISSRQKETVDAYLAGDLGGFSQLAWEAVLFSGMMTKASIDILLGSQITGDFVIDLNQFDQFSADKML